MTLSTIGNLRCAPAGSIGPAIRATGRIATSIPAVGRAAPVARRFTAFVTIRDNAANDGDVIAGISTPITTAFLPTHARAATTTRTSAGFAAILIAWASVAKARISAARATCMPALRAVNNAATQNHLPGTATLTQGMAP